AYRLHRYPHSFPTRRSSDLVDGRYHSVGPGGRIRRLRGRFSNEADARMDSAPANRGSEFDAGTAGGTEANCSRFRVRYGKVGRRDRKSTRLNSSHRTISYAV